MPLQQYFGRLLQRFVFDNIGIVRYRKSQRLTIPCQHIEYNTKRSDGDKSIVSVLTCTAQMMNVIRICQLHAIVIIAISTIDAPSHSLQ
jgi:hypothetical protein